MQLIQHSLFSKYEYTKPFHNLNESRSDGFLEVPLEEAVYSEILQELPLKVLEMEHLIKI